MNIAFTDMTPYGVCPVFGQASLYTFNIKKYLVYIQITEYNIW